MPFGQDGNYSHEAIVNRINADLANDLGNLAQRSLSMIAQATATAMLPTPGAFSETDKTILAAADGMIGKAREAMKTQQLHQVLNAVWAVVADANRYFAGEAPWALRQDRSGAAGHGALRHRRGDPAGRDPGAAVHAGIGGEAARSPRGAGRRSAALPTLGGAPPHRRRRTALPAPTPVFPRYVDSATARPELMTPCWSTAIAISISRISPTSSTPSSRAPAAGIGRMVTISTRVKRTAELTGYRRALPDVFCSVGTHPHHAHEELDVTTADLVRARRAIRKVRRRSAKPGSTITTTTARATRRSAASATTSPPPRETGLPLVIHAREADDDMARILEEEMGKGAFPAVLHCYTGGPRARAPRHRARAVRSPSPAS